MDVTLDDATLELVMEPFSQWWIWEEANVNRCQIGELR